QMRSSSFMPELGKNDRTEIAGAFEFPALTPQPNVIQTAAWEQSSSLKEEEFTRAEALGLFDYLRKSRSQGFVVSISGGADSAAVSCLVSMAGELALQELGDAGLRGKLAHIRSLPGTLTPASLTRALLTTAYQSTENSGPITREAAKAVATALGAKHY